MEGMRRAVLLACDEGASDGSGSGYHPWGDEGHAVRWTYEEGVL